MTEQGEIRLTATLSWKFRRLGAMGAREILHRTGIALRDRLYTPSWARMGAREACGELLSGVNWDEVRFRIGGLGHGLGEGASLLLGSQDARSPLVCSLREGERLLGGSWRLFGVEVKLSDPPNWRANGLSGEEWPDAPSKMIEFRRSDLAGGAKWAWEVGRLTFLHTLAVCYAVSGEDEFAERLERWLLDFCRRNPLGHGIQHASGIEQGIRNVVILYSLSLLLRAGRGVPQEVLEAALGLCVQQALHLRTHLSIGSSGNNHLVAELSGIVVVASCLAGVRGGDRKVNWQRILRAAWQDLGHAVTAQFHPDGTPAEQAFRYMPFVWELVLTGMAAGQKRGLAVPQMMVERLAASLEFARAVRLANGEVPSVGDEDDGRVLLPAEGNSRLDLVGNCLAAWLGAPRLSGTSGCLAALLFGEGDSEVSVASDGERVFPEGGYTIWRQGEVVLLWDHGPVGFGSIAAHGHADALSVVLYIGGEPLIADPGTYAYHEDRAARDRFRSTPWHSTVNFGGRNQSENCGPFLWGRKAGVVKEGEGYEVQWYTGERHWRRVSFESGQIVIEDRVAGSDAELVFVLGPDVEVSLSACEAKLSLNESRLVLRSEGLEPWRVEPGEFSPRFGWRVPTKRLCARFVDITSTTRLAL